MCRNVSSNDDQQATTAELLELLGDEYARRVLKAAAEEPVSANAIAESTEISRPTVYRRLDRLVEADLVRSELAVDSDGNHYRRYRTIFETVTLRIDEAGISLTVRPDESERRAARDSRAPTRFPSNDDAVSSPIGDPTEPPASPSR